MVNKIMTIHCTRAYLELLHLMALELLNRRGEVGTQTLITAEELEMLSEDTLEAKNASEGIFLWI